MSQTRTIPLPTLSELPRVVLFHRTTPTSPRILLRVPTGPESAESYVLRLDQSAQPAGSYNPALDHKAWLKRLPQSRELLHLLTYEMNVAYYAQDGGLSRPLTDPDEMPWIRKVMMHARQESQGPVARAITQQRRRSPRSIPAPRLASSVRQATTRSQW